jgi:hypothetical protein
MFLAPHFDVRDENSPTRPLQYLIVLKKNGANYRES